MRIYDKCRVAIYFEAHVVLEVDSDAFAFDAGHRRKIEIKVLEGIKNINKFIIRALVEAGSHGRDLSDGCDIPKYPRIKRPLDCCDVQRPAATPHSCYLSNLAATTDSACVPQCTCSSPVTAAAPSRYHFAPIDQVYRDTNP